jgi:hypothetical protein
LCWLFNFARNEERRKKTNKVRSERAKPAENGSKREESKEKKRKPCTFLFYSKPYATLLSAILLLTSFIFF